MKKGAPAPVSSKPWARLLLAAVIVGFSVVIGFAALWPAAPEAAEPVAVISAAEEELAMVAAPGPDLADLAAALEQWQEAAQTQATDVAAWLADLQAQQQGLAEHGTATQSALVRIEEQLAALTETLDGRHQELIAATEPPKPPHGVPFAFRGTEVWGGQVYALLEHHGEIFTARTGDVRMGWRIAAIDRNAGLLHVVQGQDRITLEAS